MQEFKDKKILLGVCGGIAAYKSALLVRELTSLGAEVRVVMTASAQQFIGPLTFQGLSGHEVRTDLFDSQAERAMSHIELARWADYLVIAPASANCLAKMAQGLADDLLSTLYLVAEVPTLVCPAMNHSMWEHTATQANCDLLKARGVLFVGPDEGAQACGEYGFGRLREPEQIIHSLLMLEKCSKALSGKQVIITAGPTREAIDPVRYVSNYSSGKMGYALAEAALKAGAQVTLVSGPSSLQASEAITLLRVESAHDMYEEVMRRLQPDCIFIAAAAVADYHVKSPKAQKIKKTTQSDLSLTLSPNPDILSEVAASAKPCLVVGFAAETERVIEHALEKLERKKLDMIIANQVGKGLGFESDENQVTIITKKEQIDLPQAPKTRLAEQIIAIIATTLQNNATHPRN